MTVEEDRVRTLLQTTGVPRSRLDAGGLLTDSKHAQRRRRRARVAGAVLAAVAVAAPVGVVWAHGTPERPERPERPDRVATVPGVSSTPTVTHRTSTPGRTARCTPTRYPLPGTFTWRYDFLTDATGRYVIRQNNQETVSYLWTDGKVSQLDVPGDRPGFAPVAITSTGVVFGNSTRESKSDPVRVFRFADGVNRGLPTPAGFEHAVVLGVNARGDAIGTLARPSNPAVYRPGEATAIVVWPADRPDEPRIIDDGALEPAGILDDGTVIAVIGNLDKGPLTPAALVAVAPDGARATIELTGELEGISPLVKKMSVSGDYLYGHFTRTRWPDLRPVRWNLRTGQVEIFDDLWALQVGNAQGYFSAADVNAGDTTAVIVAPDGTARRTNADQHIAWIGPTGAELIGRNLADEQVVRWRCA